MSEIIGRTEQKAVLKKTLESKEAELLAIYGRRRIGKTFLIREYFEGKGVFFELTGVLGGRASEQLWSFSEALMEAFNDKKRLSPPKNWREAFRLLLEKIQNISKDQKIILFFDELPWLATPRSSLLRALEYLWNRHLSRLKNVILILCGSAASWMIKKIIQNKGGFYGRLTQKIHLQPFSLLETENYLKKKNIIFDRKQLIEIYMVTGGVAKYLDHLEQGLSSTQLIQKLCFSENGFLKDEFDSLFASLFDDSEKHLSIVKALSSSHKGMTLTEIAKATSKQINGHISIALQDLEASGFIQLIPFYGRKKRDSLYRLLDEYSLFYLTWVKGSEKLVQYHQSQKFKTWAGYAFENICIKHAKQMIDALKLQVVAKSIAYWEKPSDELPGAQVDLIIDRTDRCLNLVEMKFWDGEYIMKREYADRLIQKRNIFSSKIGDKKTIFNTLIKPFGAAKNPPYHSCIDQELTLDALFTL